MSSLKCLINFLLVLAIILIGCSKDETETGPKEYLVNAEKTDNKLLEKDLQNEKQLINCKGDKKQ